MQQPHIHHSLCSRSLTRSSHIPDLRPTAMLTLHLPHHLHHLIIWPGLFKFPFQSMFSYSRELVSSCSLSFSSGHSFMEVGAESGSNSGNNGISASPQWLGPAAAAAPAPATTMQSNCGQTARTCPYVRTNPDSAAFMGPSTEYSHPPPPPPPLVTL